MPGGAGQQEVAPVVRRRGGLVAVAAVALMLAGISAVAGGLLAQQNAPTGPQQGASEQHPPSNTAMRTPAFHRNRHHPMHTQPIPGTSGAPKPTATHSAPAAVAARPTHLRIPTIGVDTDLVELGLNPDGSLAVPLPGPDYDKAGWFNGSPFPGDIGPAVIEGHIDSAANGPSVFFELGALQPGDEIFVDRADRSSVSFTVDAVSTYPKSDFPTLRVYGNTPDPELRLITCGGDFDSTAGSYDANTVIYAHHDG